jgi:hypothetical protein
MEPPEGWRGPRRKHRSGAPQWFPRDPGGSVLAVESCGREELQFAGPGGGISACNAASGTITQRSGRCDRRRTDPQPVHLDAEVAQLVEQRIRNAWVGGSSPLFGTTCQTVHTGQIGNTLGFRPLAPPASRLVEARTILQEARPGRSAHACAVHPPIARPGTGRNAAGVTHTTSFPGPCSSSTRSHPFPRRHVCSCRLNSDWQEECGRALPPWRERGGVLLRNTVRGS